MDQNDVQRRNSLQQERKLFLSPFLPLFQSLLLSLPFPSPSSHILFFSSCSSTFYSFLLGPNYYSWKIQREEEEGETLTWAWCSPSSILWPLVHCIVTTASFHLHSLSPSLSFSLSLNFFLFPSHLIYSFYFSSAFTSSHSPFLYFKDWKRRTRMRRGRMCE